MTAIMNYLEAGMTMLSKTLDEENKSLHTVMQKSSDQAKRAAQILSRLRQFIETGDVEKNMINVTETIEQSLELVRPSFKNQGIKFAIENPDGALKVLANSVQLQQVLVNLIRNACESMETSVEKSLIISASRNASNALEIEVSDTGIGLTEGAYEKLFEPFSSTKTGGLGVGLSISQTIISNHDGKMWSEEYAARYKFHNITAIERI